MIADAEHVPSGAAEKPKLPGATTVLIIEDDAGFRELLGMHLAAAGYQVLLAEDAVVGGRMLLASRPDLVLLDVRMPYLGGLELLAAVRQDPNVAATPIICLTSMRDEAIYAQAMELGVAAFLTKPVQGEELLATVARVLKAAHR